MFSQNNDIAVLDECLACGSNSLVSVLDLKTQPLANSYKDFKSENQSSFPLAINRCTTCHHVQLTHAVNPDLMFKNYMYVSGTSATMNDHFKWFANYTYEYFTALSALKPTRVLDIGCNDGSQLNHFKNLGMVTVGVDPALNLHAMSGKKHMVYPTYFDMKFVEDHPGVYDILVAQNVFAHNYNPKAFLTAARNLMSHDSLLFIQTSQADMILNSEFDTIYHEHVSFFNTRSMRMLCERAGLYLMDSIKCPLHGNSYIFVVTKNKLVARPHNVSNIEEMEKTRGLYSPVKYTEYALRSNAIAQELKSTLMEYKKEGWKVIGYGAAAKGMTLLNYAGLDDTVFDYIVDDNVLKQGKFTPGTNIEIVGSARVTLEDPKTSLVFVPLAWNFYGEIVSKIKRLRPDSTDDYVQYFPEVMVKIA